MSHETLWITQHVGTAPTPRRRSAGARIELTRGGAPGTGVSQLRVSVAAGLADRGRGGLSPQACAGAAAQVDRPAVRTVAAVVAAGGQGQWLPQRTVGVEAHRRRDSGAVWRGLSPGACLEGLAPVGLELPGAGTPAHPARRGCDRALETRHVASDKKKSAAWGLISPS